MNQLTMKAPKSKSMKKTERTSTVVGYITLILMSVVFFTSNLFEYLNQPLAVAEQASSYTKIIALSIMPSNRGLKPCT